MGITREKKKGIHYTPPALAEFLAERIVACASLDAPNPVVLDPACGEGELLRAFVEAVPHSIRPRLKLIGYDTDGIAATECGENLSELGVDTVDVRIADFLEASTIGEQRQTGLFDDSPEIGVAADVVISNPPYVRTQVLGSQEAQRLAGRFGLAGRVDLYHAFTAAMIAALRPGGVLGLLTSNRFLFTRAGKSMRRLLRAKLRLHSVIDLGDTKLFEAAVLPAIVVGTREDGGTRGSCMFVRVYEDSSEKKGPGGPAFPSVLDALREKRKGTVATPAGNYRVEEGRLGARRDSSEPWFLVTPDLKAWMHTTRSHTHCLFDDIAEVKVGIKTTADAVFIREDWEGLDESMRPEPDLLRPLLTHQVAERWRLSTNSSELSKRVLYPHEMVADRRLPIELDRYPRARSYLAAHRERLASREYVLNSGRRWYEIWVPQDPAGWTKPKLVWPDISLRPCFYVDYSGAVVNGDCYWLTLRQGIKDEVLLLLLGVANSSFAEKFYDVRFHNKLYSGRRRFITQYVEEFPVPDPSSSAAAQIISAVQQLLSVAEPIEHSQREQALNEAVCGAFGLFEEVAG